MGPATFTVLFIVGIMIVVGALILRSGSHKTRAARRCPAADCRRPNDPKARFCAHCGAELPGE